MDKIDLDAILEDKVGRMEDFQQEMCIKEAMKEAIHQALVLVSEKAELAWKRGYLEHITNDKQEVCFEHHNNSTIYYIDKESILDVEKLIV